MARLDRIDDAVGGAIERAVAAHHRRRLTRHGWRHALEPADDGLWCAGDPPPLDGNAIEVLIDGEEALPRLEDEIAGAKESVWLAGWTFTPEFRLSRGGGTLRELLADVSKRAEVRVLAWAGAPLPLFTPSRKQVADARKRLVDGTSIRMALDARERPMHCHHEKLVVVDGRIAYVGGIDLTLLAGDRLDSREHPARGTIGWHDAALRIEGPLVADVADHVAMRWREVTGEALAASNSLLQAGDTTGQFVRTIPNDIYDAVPNGDFRIAEAYVRALRSAEKLIYLESQFLWSPEITAILRDKLRNPPSDEFRMVVVLPAHPNNGQDDTRGQLGLMVADDHDDRLLACSLFQPGRVQQVYVHAKVGIVDDRWLCIGSANLNEHSFFNDTEACVITCDEELARETRLRLWREHAGRDDVDFDVLKDVAERGDERLALLPHLSRRTRAFLGPINGLLVDG